MKSKSAFFCIVSLFCSLSFMSSQALAVEEDGQIFSRDYDPLIKAVYWLGIAELQEPGSKIDDMMRFTGIPYDFLSKTPGNTPTALFTLVISRLQKLLEDLPATTLIAFTPATIDKELLITKAVCLLWRHMKIELDVEENGRPFLEILNNYFLTPTVPPLDFLDYLESHNKRGEFIFLLRSEANLHLFLWFLKRLDPEVALRVLVEDRSTRNNSFLVNIVATRSRKCMEMVLAFLATLLDRGLNPIKLKDVLIDTKTLSECRKHADSERDLRSLMEHMNHADWKTVNADCIAELRRAIAQIRTRRAYSDE